MQLNRYQLGYHSSFTHLGIVSAVPFIQLVPASISIPISRPYFWATDSQQWSMKGKCWVPPYGPQRSWSHSEFIAEPFYPFLSSPLSSHLNTHYHAACWVVGLIEVLHFQTNYSVYNPPRVGLSILVKK